MKKILSILMVVILTVTLTSFVGIAASSETETSDISVQDRAQQIEDILNAEGCASAYTVTEDGEQIPLDVTYSVRALPKARIGNDSGANSYAITAFAASKATSNTGNKNNSDVVLSGSMTMYWTDVSGTKNTIDSLNGNYKLTSGTVTNSTVSWGPGTSNFYDSEKIGTENKFDISTDYTTTSLLGMIFAEYKIYYKTSTGTGSLIINVCPSVID